MAFWSGIFNVVRRLAGRRFRPRAFLSHSWDDKPLARRIARRLSHRGVRVWVDEYQMGPGTVLSDRIASEIAATTHLVVLVTKAALESDWVMQEIRLAQSQVGTSIVPLIAEDVQSDLLKNSLSTVVSDPWTFETQLDKVAGAILGRPVSGQRDIDLLKQDLLAIGQETPALGNLITLLGGERGVPVSASELPVIQEPLRHPAETALIALYESTGPKVRRPLALVTAGYFLRLGVGYEVLRRQILDEPGGSDDVFDTFSALTAYPPARPADLAGILRLFDLASPPMDQAFKRLIDRTFGQFTEEQRQWAVRFMTMPVRPPIGFTADAAFDLFALLPDDASLLALWRGWVHDYEFGGSPNETPEQSCRQFYGLMNEAHRKQLKQFEPVMTHFQSRFKRLARTPELESMLGAVRLIKTAAEPDLRYVRRHDLAAELAQAVHSSEWEDFKYRKDFAMALLELAYDVAKDKPYDDMAIYEIFTGIEQREGRALIKRGASD